AADRVPFAIECCRRAAACDPDALDAFRLRFALVRDAQDASQIPEAAEAASAALLRAGLEDEAMQLLTEAIAAAPQADGLIASLAARHLESGRLEEGFNLLHDQCRALFTAGEHARTIALARRGMELFPDRTDFRRILAET